MVDLGERVDQPDALVRRDLDHAQTREVAELADELGVVRERPDLAHVVDDLAHAGVVGHERRLALGHER